MRFESQIITDGNSDLEASAGAAAIYRDRLQGHKYKFCALLGPASSSEAELLAAILGFSLLEVLGQQKRETLWLSDHLPSLDLLSSASRCRAPELLQDVFCAQGRGLNLLGKHCPRKSRVPDQLACDRAARWAMRSGKKLLNDWGEGAIGSLRETDPARAWHFIDMRTGLQQFRESAKASTFIGELKRKLAVQLSSTYERPELRPEGLG